MILSANIDLLPCPFCGGTELLPSVNGAYCLSTSCEGCVAFGHSCGIDEDADRKCKEVVAKAWNTRADNEFSGTVTREPVK